MFLSYFAARPDKVVGATGGRHQRFALHQGACRQGIDRERPRSHLSFGFGIHRCVGNRLAELQLTIIWEEILARFPEVRLVREPLRTHSVFVKGYETLPVVIPTRN